MTTKRQKLEAMANQTASPEEAKVAKAMLAKTQDPLDRIADSIRAEYGKGIEAQFAIGRLLMKARDMLPGNVEFGKWVDAQQFPFSRQVAWRLRVGAEREPEVRAMLVDSDQKQRGGPERTVSGMVQALIAGPQPVDRVAEAFPPVAVDQSLSLLRQAHHRILSVEVGEDGTEQATGNTFLSMHVDDLVASAGYIKDLVNAYQTAKAAR